MVDAVIETHEGVLYHILGETLIVRNEKRHTHGFGLVTPHQGFQPANITRFETPDCLQVIHAGRSPLEMLDASHYIYRHSPKKVGESHGRSAGPVSSAPQRATVRCPF